MTLNGILALSDPLAVAGLVILGVILSADFNRQRTSKRTLALRRITHVSQEIDELVPPPTDLDSFRSVILKRRALFVIAPGLHVGPNTMNSRALKAVLTKTIASLLVPKASATPVGFLPDQTAGPNLDSSPAVALAVPEANPFTARCSTRYQKPTRACAGQIYNSHLL